MTFVYTAHKHNYATTTSSTAYVINHDFNHLIHDDHLLSATTSSTYFGSQHPLDPLRLLQSRQSTQSTTTSSRAPTTSSTPSTSTHPRRPRAPHRFRHGPMWSSEQY